MEETPAVNPPLRRRTRDPFVSRKIRMFLDSHPDTEFSKEAIAKQTNLTYQQVSQAMSGMLKRNEAQRASVRGFWRAAVKGSTTVAVVTPSRNGSGPIIATGDLLEVFRVRQDGDIVIVDANRDIWIAHKTDI